MTKYIKDKVRNIDGHGLGKMDKKISKMKRKSEKKIAAIKRKSQKKSIGKTDEYVTKIKKKTQKKVEKCRKKYDHKIQKRIKRLLKNESRSMGKKIGFFFVKMLTSILVIGIFISTVLGVLVYFGFVDIPVVNKVMDRFGIKQNDSNIINLNEYLDYSNDERTSQEGRVDSLTYYDRYSKIINKVSMEKYTDMMSEEEAYNLFQSYGFTDCIIISEYTETGEYSGPNEVIPFSSVKHPVYRSDYVDEKGNIFELYLIGGCLMTNPVSYNSKVNSNIKVVVSSADTLISFDSRTKTFYETLPKNSILKIEKASDAYIETLENLIIEEETI